MIGTEGIHRFVVFLRLRWVFRLFLHCAYHHHYQDRKTKTTPGMRKKRTKRRRLGPMGKVGNYRRDGRKKRFSR